MSVHFNLNQFDERETKNKQIVYRFSPTQSMSMCPEVKYRLQSHMAAISLALYFPYYDILSETLYYMIIWISEALKIKL